MPEVLSELVAKITADTTELKKGLAESEKGMADLGKVAEKEAKSVVQSFKEAGKSLTIIGGAITAAFTGAIMSFTKTGSELYDLSLKTGVSVKALAGLKYAAEQNGASLGTVEMAIRRTASAMQDAKDGLTETQRAFDRMGLSLSSLEGLKPEQQFMAIASAIANIPDPMTRAATAQDLFGRSGMDMLPMLSQGADGLRKMMEEGVKLTGWTDEGAESADTLGDAFGTLTTSTMGIFNAIGESLAPTLIKLVDTIVKIVTNIRDWAKVHPVLFDWIVKITGVVGLLTFALGFMALIINSTLIPTMIALITALWALVAAKLAAMAATGVLLPAVIALVVGIGLLTFGVMELGKSQIAQIDTTNKAAQANDALGSSIEKTNSEIEKQARAAEKATEAIRAYWAAVNKISALEMQGAEPFLSAEHRERYIREAQEWEWKGKQFQAAGDMGAALFAFNQANAMWRRIQSAPSFQYGGIVSGPVGAPQLAMVHGGETITPPGENGGITINFTQPVFFDREDTMNRFVDMIRKGIQRQDRIRFGGAYSGS